MELAKINPHIDDDNEADADVECALGGMETEEAVGGGVGTGEIVFKGGMETEGVVGEEVVVSTSTAPSVFHSKPSAYALQSSWRHWDAVCSASSAVVTKKSSPMASSR